MQLGTGTVTCQSRPDDDHSLDAIHDEMLVLGRTIDDARGVDETG
jgi:hypothetical protein